MGSEGALKAAAHHAIYGCANLYSIVQSKCKTAVLAVPTKWTSMPPSREGTSAGAESAGIIRY